MITELIGNIVSLLAGCGLFMLGFKILSTNMEKLAGAGLKKFFNKISNNKFLGIGVGMLTTIVIQSSSVTTVMVIGFVNSGIMTLIQATSVIIGANIGTTITAYIAALKSVAEIVDWIFLILLFIGVFLEMFAKKDRIKILGLVLAGLGAVFMGLEAMSSSMKFLQDIQSIRDFIGSLDNPFLLFFISIIFTAVVQSSSAVTSIIVIICATNQLAFGGTGNAVYFLILGANVGTCVTALISSVGASTNAKRASIIHLLFNTFGAVLFSVILLCWKGFSSTLIESWITQKQWQIAAFHTIFNVSCAIIVLPLSKYLVRIATFLVKDKEEKTKSNAELLYMDKRLLTSPSIAVDMLKKDVFRMADISMELLSFSFDGFVERNTNVIDEIESKNDDIASLGQKITDYLVQVSSLDSSFIVEKEINQLHKNVADVARIAELAENMTKYIKRAVKEEIVFSPEILAKVRIMCELLQAQYQNIKAISLEGEISLLKKVSTVEDEVDEMRRALVQEHINRLSQGLCKPENNAVFINLVSNLERIGDHLAYMVGVN